MPFLLLRSSPPSTHEISLNFTSSGNLFPVKELKNGLTIR